MASVKGTDLSKLLLEVFFQGKVENLPAALYLGLANGPLPSSTDTLAAIDEIVGAGYARVAFARTAVDFPTLTLVDGYWKVTSLQKEFEVTGDSDLSADYAFLADVAAGTVGKWFLAVAVPDPARLLAGDSLNAIFEHIDR